MGGGQVQQQGLLHYHRWAQATRGWSSGCISAVHTLQDAAKEIPITANHLECHVCSKINNLPTGNPLAKATTLIAMAKSAYFARCRITGKSSAGRESKPTNSDWIQMDAHSGPRSRTPAPTTMRHQYKPWTSRSWIFSFELDGTPTSSSAHHSSDYYECVCHLNREL